MYQEVKFDGKGRLMLTKTSSTKKSPSCSTGTCGCQPEAVHLREPQRVGEHEHFAPSDPSVDLLKLPIIGKPLTKLMKSRAFQFLAILPNQLVFWLVIFGGAIGVQLPNSNFATVITWFIWFAIVFVIIVGVGRGWCMMCPFGGGSEWLQRFSFIRRRRNSVGLQKKWPESLARLGVLPSVLTFLFLTWIEEYFNIAGPGAPIMTTFMVLGIIGSAAIVFFVFERRTFCRYLCPLTALIGTAGAVGMVAGFRTRDREVCLNCETKDCMRGSERGYGCPWYEWPGSATSNLMCGLCTECLKNCPEDNVGMFIQAPMTSVIKPVKKRIDVAWSAALLFGLVVFQQANALDIYTKVDDYLAKLTGIAYPNPIDYLGITFAVAGIIGAYAWVVRKAFAKKNPDVVTPAEAGGLHGYASWFAPLAYGLIPLVAVDYLARQLPKFFFGAPRIIAAISDPFGFGWNLFGTAHLAIANAHLASTPTVIMAQIIVVAIGTLGSAYSTFRIVNHDLNGASTHPALLKIVTVGSVMAMGIGMAVLYVLMGGAQ